MRDRAERIGLNEALFREVNERVKGNNDGFGGTPAAIAEQTDPRS